MISLFNKNKTVFVGVSGGVDSAVALVSLKDKGYKVVGVFIKTWTPSFIDCTWRSERRDAMRVCAHIGVPFLECDAEKEYKEAVAEYMIEEYKNGNTPNPDVMCNREIKFGVFWKFARSHGADFIATGHYAICEKRDSDFILKQSPDKEKDQSYFLWKLNQNDLSHTLFPVGHLNKKEVRKLAKKYNLPNAVKKDSQGVCFLGKLNMKDFLSHYIESKKGDVLDEDGKIIGIHSGAVFLTIGERHGFSINNELNNNKPYYVISKDIKNNTITVSNNNSCLTKNNNKSISCRQANWISGKPLENKEYGAVIRYHGELIKSSVKFKEEDRIIVTFTKNILVDKGQSIVIFDKGTCLGGAIVE